MAERNPWTSDDLLAWSAFLRAHAETVRRIDADVAAKSGIPLRWYDVLLELDRVPDHRLPMQELGERVVLSRSRVSRVVDELERARLVARHSNPDDGRSWFAALTPAGRQKLRRAAPVYLEAIKRHFTAHLDRTTVKDLRRTLEILAESDEEYR